MHPTFDQESAKLDFKPEETQPISPRGRNTASDTTRESRRSAQRTATSTKNSRMQPNSPPRNTKLHPKARKRDEKMANGNGRESRSS
jgi:hypothetical protein